MTSAVEAPVWTTANRMYVRTGVSAQAVLTRPTRIDVLVRKVA